MPKISTRGHIMPESPIRKLVPYSEKAKERGINVYHLNIGQPDISTPQVALDAVKNNTVEILSYSRSEGSEEYRKKIAGYYKQHNIHVSSDEILVTTGASEALRFMLSSITNPGDEIIIPEPFYANYIGFSTSNSVKIIPVLSNIDDNFALPDISDFEKLITPKTKAILICNPANPTGYLYSKEEIHTLVKIVKKHDLFLISDEVYREFVYDDEKHYSILSDEFNLGDNAILLDSVSKRYSMCGARIGYLVSRNKDVLKTVLKFSQTRLSPPTYAQIASEAALETPQLFFDNVISEFQERRNTLITELQKIKGVKVSRPKGAFYCVVELPIDDSDKFAQYLLEEFSDDNETIMVAPASGFYSTKGLGKNQIRIAYVLKKEDLIRSVQLLKLALTKYNQQ
ncbi:pyridoxal phosphate-dependent aminotransferase [Urechidicola croceus]|uniref:Aminotransferase n=1 Tax=Urechidicola croceus TaxID=1850246 RepID=A0A1D8P624_9FLAO|nr:pyridoxal phosphate-dependent aminotransferase [Urechidicola croceus]AOW20024.1 aspartate aminotransferase [Urechidicola croceus]